MLRLAAPRGYADVRDASILIVEDEPSTVETFQRMLEVQGYGVQVAVDVQSGLAELARATPAAVLLDLRFPTADGLVFLRQLRATARFARIPVAVVTGDYLIDEQVACEIGKLGAEIHFKPLWEEDLLQIVHDLLRPQRVA